MSSTTRLVSPPISIDRSIDRLLVLRLGRLHLLVAEEGEEDVVEDLDGVDVEEALRGRNEREVHRVRRHPYRPTTKHKQPWKEGRKEGSNGQCMN